MTIFFGKLTTPARAHVGCTTSAPNMNERLDLGSGEDGSNDWMWVKKKLAYKVNNLCQSDHADGNLACADPIWHALAKNAHGS